MGKFKHVWISSDEHFCFRCLSGKYIGIFPAFVLIFVMLSWFLYLHWRRWVYLARCLCSILMGDFNQTSLLVLHLLQCRLVDQTLLAIHLWGQCKTLDFWHRCLCASYPSRKEVFAHMGLEVYLLDLFKRTSVFWGEGKGVCSQWPWELFLCADPTWRSCHVCQVVFSCPVRQGVRMLCLLEGLLCSFVQFFSPLWPPPSPSVWDCGQISLPHWPQLYPTIVCLFI